MIARKIHLRVNERGAAAIEMALSFPILILMIYGIFTLGQLFEAAAGMQHALGEAARYATIYPTPTDTQIRAKLTAKKFGTSRGTLSTPTIVTDATNGYKTISLTYSQPTDFLFFDGPTVTITRSKRVYVAA
jgi:Flp pilus assembly protein TadG